MPADMIEGPLSRVCDGMMKKSEGVEVSEKLELVQTDAYRASKNHDDVGLWRNVALSHLVKRGTIKIVPESAYYSDRNYYGLPVYDIETGTLLRFEEKKPVDINKTNVRSRTHSYDDIVMIRHAKDHNAIIISNDAYRDHIRSCSAHSKYNRGNKYVKNYLGFNTKREFRRWLSQNRKGFHCVIHGPPSDMYPEAHPIRQAAERDDLSIIPDLYLQAAANSDLSSYEIMSIQLLL